MEDYENSKPNYYAVIPAIVRYDNDVMDKAKILYGEISALSGKYGYCFATNQYFANLYRLVTYLVCICSLYQISEEDNI